jgi:hypothetical protein
MKSMFCPQTNSSVRPPISSLLVSPRTSAYGRHVTEILVLLDSSGHGDHEQQHPRHPDLGKHLQVDPIPPLPPQRKRPRSEQPRVQARTHEHVVNHVARHPQRFPSVMASDGEGVDEKGEEEGDDDGPRHQFSEMFDQVREMEDARDVEDGREDDGGVERGEGVAVVHQRLVVERGNGKACGSSSVSRSISGE